MLSSEEMVKAKDEGDYFRIPLDARSLEYELYFEEGERCAGPLTDYTSANTEQLNLQATKELLLTLPEMRALTEVAA